MSKVERYINEDGKVGVLISGGYGAGWSTWADSKDREFFLFDWGLVKLALEKEAAWISQDNTSLFGRGLVEMNTEALEVYLKENGVDSFTGGWAGVYVKWMDQGTEFIVEEYDGSESLRYRDNEDWMSA
tara:strand:- start:9 stop:395 length:387 start_codon:yes stop_codon:yes gene_type:complete